jgi:maleate cis-trans isomerase
MPDSPSTLGFLYPGLGVAEDDLIWLVECLFPDETVGARVVETPIDEDAHTVEALLDLGQGWRLREGAAPLREGGVGAVVWACTSGSFVFGWEGAQRQVAELAEFTGVPTSSTSLAFVAALRALGVERVSIAATYPEPVTSCFVGLLGDAGFDVVQARSNDIMTAAGAGAIAAGEVSSLVRGGDHPDAEAVLVPDTALHTVRSIPVLERTLGKPVLSANQVTVWEGLRQLGGFEDGDARPAGDGSVLFACAPRASRA